MLLMSTYFVSRQAQIPRVSPFRDLVLVPPQSHKTRFSQARDEMHLEQPTQALVDSERYMEQEAQLQHARL